MCRLLFLFWLASFCKPLLDGFVDSAQPFVTLIQGFFASVVVSIGHAPIHLGGAVLVVSAVGGTKLQRPLVLVLRGLLDGAIPQCKSLDGRQVARLAGVLELNGDACGCPWRWSLLVRLQLARMNWFLLLLGGRSWSRRVAGPAAWRG